MKLPRPSAEETRAHMEDPDFQATMIRARAKARGQRIERVLPAAVPPKDRTLGDFAELVARVCRVPKGRVLAAGQGGDIAPPPPKPLRTAGQWRIEHYIPERHRECVLEVCPAPQAPTDALPAGQCRCEGVRHFVPQNESQRRAFRAVERFCAAAIDGRGPAMILVGPTGVGKSHLLWAACRVLNERDLNAAGVSWKRLSDTIRDAKSHPDNELRARACYERDRVSNAACLCLDEVRATAGTEFDPMELALIAVERHDRMQALLMTSQQRGASLTALTDSASTGRLVIQEMVGANYRKPTERQLAAS